MRRVSIAVTCSVLLLICLASRQARGLGDMVQALIQRLDDKDPAIRAESIKKLGTQGLKAGAALPRLIQALSDPDEAVRDEAAVAVGEVGGPSDEAIKALVGLLGNNEMNPFAIEGLKAIGLPAIPKLEKAMRDPRGSNNYPAATALAAMKASNTLIAAAQDPDPNVRRVALLAIGHMGADGEEALPQVMRALSDPDLLVRLGAVDALGSELGYAFKREAIPALIKSLRVEDSMETAICETAAGELSGMGPEVIPLLVQALKFKVTHHWAEDALKRMNTPETQAALHDNMDQPKMEDSGELGLFPQEYCVPRELFPDALKSKVEEVPGHLGLMNFGPVSPSFCDDQWGCHLFSSEEMAAWIKSRSYLNGAAFIACELGTGQMPGYRPLPEGCQPRDNYSATVRNTVPAVPGYSGLEFLYGTSEGYCRTAPSCSLLKKTQFETLISRKIYNYADSTMFAIVSCRLENDFAVLIQDELKKALESAPAERDEGAQKFLKSIQGEWCGLYPGDPGKMGSMEIRLDFRNVKNRIVGEGTLAWGRPLGTAGYVDKVQLVPQWMNPAQYFLILSEVSRYRSGNSWKLHGIDMVLTDDQSRSFPLKRSCEGFWKIGVK